MKKSSKTVIFFGIFMLIMNFLTLPSLYASNSDKHKKAYDEARKYMKNGLYNLALKELLPVVKSEPQNPNFNYCLGICYYHTSPTPDSAIIYLTKATKSVTSYFKHNFRDDKAPVETYFFLGMAYMRNGMTETAVNHFKHYQRFFEQEGRMNKSIRQDVNLQIAVCEREKSNMERMKVTKKNERDSIYKEMDFYKTHYREVVSLLEERDHEIERLEEELSQKSNSQIKPISAYQGHSMGKNQNQRAVANNRHEYTIQVLASVVNMPLNSFPNLTDVQKCYLPDGYYHYTVGAFETRREAEEYCRQIRAQGYPDAWIRPIIRCMD